MSVRELGRETLASNEAHWWRGSGFGWVDAGHILEAGLGAHSSPSNHLHNSSREVRKWPFWACVQGGVCMWVWVCFERLTSGLGELYHLP